MLTYSDMVKENPETKEDYANEFEYAFEWLDIEMFREDDDYKIKYVMYHLRLYPPIVINDTRINIPAYSQECIDRINKYLPYIGNNIIRSLDRESIEIQVATGDVFIFRKSAEQINYLEYLRSAGWFEFRARVIKQRGFHCELCRSQKNLQVHHLTYERLGSERDDDVLLLCKSCHEKAHYKK